MGSSTSWLAIGSIAVAAGLLVDNIRLRGEIDAIQNTSAPASEAKRVAKSTGFMAKPMATRAAVRKQPLNVDVDEMNEEDVEARIEEEVEARVEVAVEERMDQDLDAIVDQRVEEKIQQRHEARRERMRAAMEEYVDEYIDDNGHNEDTKTQMMSVIEGSMSNLGEIFRAMRNEDIDRETAREEFGLIRDEMEASLAEVLGADEAAQFQENLRGPLGRSWRRR